MRSRKKKKHLCFIAGLMLLTVFIGVILYIGFNYILDKIQEPKYVVLEAEKNHKITWNDSVLENKIRKNISFLNRYTMNQSPYPIPWASQSSVYRF